MDELYPRLLSLTLLAKQYDIGLNIDAEEPTAWSCRWTCSSACASSRRWPAGTASAS
jgi:hypothetical protein